MRIDERSAALTDEEGRWVELDGSRGWLRRLAPEQWRNDVEPGSRDAVVRDAWLTAITTLAELGGVEWLSPLAAIFASENKLLQQKACSSLGITFVPSVLVTRPDRIPPEFGSDLVVKPLAAGHYRDESGAGRVVHATAIARDDARLGLLGGAPFLVQPRLQATRHLRVVTVLEQSWVAGLDAADLPLDWRASAHAHDSFRPSSNPAVASSACALANTLGVGYSSQDWLVDAQGRWHFLDLNPAGQWLFLPDEVADPVTHAIADWLVNNG
jgi:hypothetical protein